MSGRYHRCDGQERRRGRAHPFLVQPPCHSPGDGHSVPGDGHSVPGDGHPVPPGTATSGPMSRRGGPPISRRSGARKLYFASGSGSCHPRRPHRLRCAPRWGAPGVPPASPTRFRAPRSRRLDPTATGPLVASLRKLVNGRCDVEVRELRGLEGQGCIALLGVTRAKGGCVNVHAIAAAVVPSSAWRLRGEPRKATTRCWKAGVDSDAAGARDRSGRRVRWRARPRRSTRRVGPRLRQRSGTRMRDRTKWPVWGAVQREMADQTLVLGPRPRVWNIGWEVELLELEGRPTWCAATTVYEVLGKGTGWKQYWERRLRVLAGEHVHLDQQSGRPITETTALLDAIGEGHVVVVPPDGGEVYRPGAVYRVVMVACALGPEDLARDVADVQAQLGGGEPGPKQCRGALTR